MLAANAAAEVKCDVYNHLVSTEAEATDKWIIEYYVFGPSETAERLVIGSVHYAGHKHMALLSRQNLFRISFASGQNEMGIAVS